MTATVSIQCGAAMTVAVFVGTLLGMWWIARYDEEGDL